MFVAAVPSSTAPPNMAVNRTRYGMAARPRSAVAYPAPHGRAAMPQRAGYLYVRAHQKPDPPPAISGSPRNAHANSARLRMLHGAHRPRIYGEGRRNARRPAPSQRVTPPSASNRRASGSRSVRSNAAERSAPAPEAPARANVQSVGRRYPLGFATNLSVLHRRVRPNTSVNARPSGGPLGPRAAHCHHAARGPSVPPPGPRYLER